MFDAIVITAANEPQAAGYRAQLEWRKKAGLIPAATECLVVPDPGGKRIGSLGATVNALKAIGDVVGRRALICHSGGDSRRTPAYAALGKVFTPMPLASPDGEPLALFDLIVANADALAAPQAGQALVLSGDVLLTFDSASADFSKPGVTGVAYRDSTAQGARHGVYVPAGGGKCVRVNDFLQKPSPDAAKRAGAVDADGRVAVDTGILSLSPAVCAKLVAWCERESLGDFSKAPPMDIYEAFTRALVGADDSPASLRRALKGVAFNVNELAFCDFFHMGSSRELLAGLTEDSPTADAYAFRTGGGAYTAFNSFVGREVEAHGALIEGCDLSRLAAVRLAGRNVLTGVPACCTAAIDLPPEMGLVCLPIGEKDWAAVAYPFDDAYVKNVFWFEKLWRVGKINDVVKEAVACAKLGFGGNAKVQSPKSKVRYAFGELPALVNHARLLALRGDVRDKLERVRRDNLAKVAAAVSDGFALPSAPRKAAILEDQVVWVTTPVRIDLAGGWSDTPPICQSCGGTVFGAALTLNGQYPVQAMAKLNDRRVIRISSIDLGQSREFASAAEIQDHSDPHDWCALVKAALVIAGVAPSKKGAALGPWLDALGGGLDVTTFSALPKGSGLGTSSVLGAAVLACLGRVLGVPFDSNRLIRLTSILEQRLSTGGGWEDQVCGTLPGLKLMTTKKGLDQTPAVRRLDAASEAWFAAELKKRCLLYFTGQKRMARNILRNVVNGFLAGEERVAGTIEPLKACARKSFDAVARRDFAAFAECVREYWELKKRIDPGSTNRPIEKMLERARPHADAMMLPGAGGGGFIFIVAKSARHAAAIRADFTAAPPNALARFFDFAVDAAGLSVTVL